MVSSAFTVILEYVCPALGCIMANVMFTAPYTAVKNAVARGHMGDLNPTPWAFMMGNTIGWVAYSILLHNYFIFFANCPGFLLSVWFNLCAVKLQHQTHCATEMRQSFEGFLLAQNSQSSTDDSSQSSTETQSTSLELLPIDTTDQEMGMKTVQLEEGENNACQITTADLGALVLQVTAQHTPAPAPHEKVVLGIIVIWTLVLSLVALSDFEPRTRELIVGIIVNVNLFFFYGAPLSTIGTVLKDRNSASIHIWTMATNTVSSAFWTAYGIAVLDPFIYVLNGIGVILGVSQIVLIILFPRKHSVAPNTEIVAKELILEQRDEPPQIAKDEEASQIGSGSDATATESGQEEV